MLITAIIVDYARYASFLAPGRNPATDRRLASYQAAANKAGMALWHSKYLPQHFVPGNTKYQLQPRKLPYKKIKKRLAEGGTVFVRGERLRERVQRGGVVDLVRSGISERMARKPTPIAAYKQRAVILIEVKRAVALRPAAGRPDMRLEVINTPENEREDIRFAMGRVYVEQIKHDPVIMRRTLS